MAECMQAAQSQVGLSLSKLRQASDNPALHTDMLMGGLLFTQLSEKRAFTQVGIASKVQLHACLTFLCCAFHGAMAGTFTCNRRFLLCS